MSDEQVQETVEDGVVDAVEEPKAEDEKSSNAFDLPDDHPAMKELARVRKEAAASRVKKVEIEEAAKKWEEHVDSQKTELEKLMDKTKTLEEALYQAELEKLQGELISEFELPLEYKIAIKGSTEDEMRAVAKVLKDGLGKKSASVPDLHGGTRGEPVVPGSAKTDGGAFLRDLIDNAKQ